MIGVESKKLKRTAASRVMSWTMPAAIVEPERETPGISADSLAHATIQWLGLG